MEFFSAPNLVTPELRPSKPWHFAPVPDLLQKIRGMKKAARREWMNRKDTAWDVYTAVRGVVSSARISGENQANGIRGIVVDYDVTQSLDSVAEHLGAIQNVSLRPNYVEVSLSQKIRLVWVFERELLVNGNTHCQTIMEALFKKLSIPTLLPGYDEASIKATQIWTNGGEWHSVQEAPLSWQFIFGAAIEASKTSSAAPVEIPLAKIFDEVQKRFPNKWQGPFELDMTGIRFWDQTADNQTGCQIKPDGMLCFTGPVPFMRWEQIFGAQWVGEQRTLNLAQAASDTFFDGRFYWSLLNGIWQSRAREDVALELRTKGVSAKTGKGNAASDCDKVLHFIQTANRVDGAAPLVNYRPGVIELEGQRVLNISRVKALEPSSKTGVTPEVDFPWLDKLIKGLFREPLAIDTINAWTKRFYLALRDYRRAMGQAIFICGPKDNGKTLFCMRVLKPLFGNKSASPYEYFTGATTFNKELFESAFLALNDEEAPEKESTKTKFLARLKGFVVNPNHTYHPKFCDRLSISWTGRTCSTLNDDAWSVGQLPEVNRNTADKLCFFASHPRSDDWPDGATIEDTLERELPFYARWLMEWNPPETVVEPTRMGVRSYFDPRILSLSRQQAASFQALELLRLWIRVTTVEGQSEAVWKGTATELHSNISICNELAGVVKEWTVRRLAMSLVDLSRVPGSGIEMSESSKTRDFIINKNLVTADT